MKLKRGHKILIVGATLISIGIILSIIIFLIGGQSSYSFRTQTATISYRESIDESLDIGRGQIGTQDIKIVVKSNPSNIPINLQIIQPDDNILTDTLFQDGETFATFNPNMTGEYNIRVTNLGRQTVIIDMTSGAGFFFDANTNQPKMELGSMFLAGIVLIPIGIIVIIAGGIVWLIDKIRAGRKRKLKYDDGLM